MINEKVVRGDIVIANVKNVDGSVQKNRRVFCIISNNKANSNSPVVTAVAMTARIEKKKYLPTHKSIPMEAMKRYEFCDDDEFKLRDSTALCEQIISLDYCQIETKVATIADTEVMKNITEGVQVQVGVFTEYN